MWSWANHTPNLASEGYEMTVTHAKEICACTEANYGADNDKSVVYFDKYVMDVHEKVLFGDVRFNLMDAAGQMQTEIGAYLICDGGYHKWREAQCPLKHAVDEWSSRSWRWGRRVL